jgi:SAM-dependent methyltransferase
MADNPSDRWPTRPAIEPAEQIRSGWDCIAGAYQERYQIGVDDLHFGPMCPGNRELRIVPELEGLRVVEIGCGGGQNIVHAALAGARRAVAIDPSQRQLEHARSLASAHGVTVELHQIGAEDLGQVDGAFDVVLSAYALMYVGDVHAVMRQIEGRLVPGGVAVLSVDHPFRLAGEWLDDAFVVESYFDEGWQAWNYDFPEQGVECQMLRYHRTVGSWVSAVTSSGLVLVDLHEPLPPPIPDSFALRSKHGTSSPRNVFSPERLRRVPGSLILRAAKADAPSAAAGRTRS